MTRLGALPTEYLLGDLTLSLLIGSAVLLVAVAAVRLSVRSGLPSLLVFLAIGLALGESGLGITFDSEELTQVLGYAALVLILAEGGLTTKYSSIRSAVAPAAALSTVGVVSGGRGRRGGPLRPAPGLHRRRRSGRPQPTDAAAVFPAAHCAPPEAPRPGRWRPMGSTTPPSSSSLERWPAPPCPTPSTSVAVPPRARRGGARRRVGHRARRGLGRRVAAAPGWPGRRRRRSRSG